jgi:hypothetical protein
VDPGDAYAHFCNADIPCSSEYTCQRFPYGSPDYGVTNFDNVLVSMVNVFIMVTQEGWTDTMYQIRKATGTVAYDIVFVLILIMGFYFVLNLMIAVQFSFMSKCFTE